MQSHLRFLLQFFKYKSPGFCFKPATVAVLLFVLTGIHYSAKAVKQKPAPAIKLTFRNMVDSQVMILGDTYKNAFGEEYTMRTFKYYISDIALEQKDGKIISFNGSHLVNEADSNSRSFCISATPGYYKKLVFLIGVDSMYNISGTQTGDLDPMKGMFWTWNSGYIIAKLEATSPVSNATNNNVAYHIGGYKPGEKVSKKITLDLENFLSAKIKTKDTTEIIVQANANKWFDAVHPLKIGENAVCTTPGKLALQFADNFARMFSVASVK